MTRDELDTELAKKRLPTVTEDEKVILRNLRPYNMFVEMAYTAGFNSDWAKVAIKKMSGLVIAKPAIFNHATQSVQQARQGDVFVCLSGVGRKLADLLYPPN